MNRSRKVDFEMKLLRVLMVLTGDLSRLKRFFRGNRESLDSLERFQASGLLFESRIDTVRFYTDLKATIN